MQTRSNIYLEWCERMASMRQKIVALAMVSLLLLQQLDFLQANVFWERDMTDSKFLRHIHKAERQLKIFIYPIPPEVRNYSLMDELTPHFRLE